MSNKKAPKTLLVGGAGYIGLVLAKRLLDQGRSVTILDNFLHGRTDLSSISDHKNFKLLEGDFRNLDLATQALKDHDEIVLLAALVGEPLCDLYPEEALTTNYSGAIAFFKAARDNHIKRFIFTSTDSCYGTRENEKLDEYSPLAPISLYSDLKAKAETEMLNYPHKDGFCHTVLRLATVYGLAPRTRFDLAVNLLTREAALKGKASIFSGEQWRPLVHVTDVARAFQLVLDSSPTKTSSQVFNVGHNRHNIQFKDLAQLLKKEFPKADINIVEAQPDLRDYYVTFDKISNILGFKPLTEIEDGIRDLKKALLSGTITDPYHRLYRNIP
jgi:nucleoside-diphosphate-sugar epimerase